MKVRIATRKSLLALTQTRWVASQLWSHHPSLEIEEVHIVTQGDRILDVPLSKLGGKGLFVGEVEQALADGRADIAVHSMKDVPAQLLEGLSIVCVPEREDPRDVLVTRDGAELDGLEAGSRVGTSSLRRMCQLRAHRNDLAYAMLRGNVDTRLRKLEEGQYRAVILAYAGLKRLGLADRPLWPLPVEVSLPAVGQGVLAIEARTEDTAIREVLAPLEHDTTRLAVEAERAFSGMLEGSCSTPLAGHARIDHAAGRFRFDGMVGSLDGQQVLTAATDRYFTSLDVSARLDEARSMAREIAAQLLAQGGAEILKAAREEARLALS